MEKKSFLYGQVPKDVENIPSFFSAAPSIKILTNFNFFFFQKSSITEEKKIR